MLNRNKEALAMMRELIDSIKSLEPKIDKLTMVVIGVIAASYFLPPNGVYRMPEPAKKVHELEKLTNEYCFGKP